MAAPRLLRGALGDGGVWSRAACMAVDPTPLAFFFFPFFAFVGDNSAPFALAGRIATTALRQDELGARTPASVERSTRKCQTLYGGAAKG